MIEEANEKAGQSLDHSTRLNSSLQKVKSTMFKQYSIKPYDRKDYSCLTLQLLVKEIEELNAQANKFSIPRHTIITRALKRGLPEVIAALEGRARLADQANGNTPTSVKE